MVAKINRSADYARRVDTAHRLNAMIKNGEEGGTVRLAADEANPTHGYFVGGAAPAVKRPIGRLTAQDVYDYTDKYPNAPYVGFWTNEALVYLDVSDWYESKDQAMAVARRRAELAVWDITRQMEIGVRY